MERPALSIQDLLLLDERSRPLLHVPDFVLAHGEVCGVYGASRGGTNLFLSCISGMQRPDTGAISIYGVPLEFSASNKAPVGFMPRESGVFPDYTVAENIKLAIRHLLPRKPSLSERRRHRDRVLSMLKLQAWVHTPAKRLPDGVCQRLSLACALVHGPRLLVADDPWGRADIESRDLIERALRDHCDRGNTLLFASLREAEITAIATDICLFDQSTLVARGTLDHLREYLDARETIVVRVHDRAALLADRVGTLSGVLGCEERGDTVYIYASPDSIRLTRLAEHVQDLGLELLGMHIETPRLSEIYATVVGEGVGG